MKSITLLRLPVPRFLGFLGFLGMLLFSCGEKPAWETKPLNEPGERTYRLHGVIVSRDAGSNTVMVRHDRVEGLMEGMTMDFSVRGASVTSLPPDNASIDASLHVKPGAYWLTHVQKSSK
jgi:hypothetical protein